MGNKERDDAVEIRERIFRERISRSQVRDHRSYKRDLRNNPSVFLLDAQRLYYIYILYAVVLSEERFTAMRNKLSHNAPPRVGEFCFCNIMVGARTMKIPCKQRIREAISCCNSRLRQKGPMTIKRSGRLAKICYENHNRYFGITCVCVCLPFYLFLSKGHSIRV